MLLYAISRFVVEIYRGDARGMILGRVDVAVRVGADRAAGDRHAAAASAGAQPRARPAAAQHDAAERLRHT